MSASTVNDNHRPSSREEVAAAFRSFGLLPAMLQGRNEQLVCRLEGADPLGRGQRTGRCRVTNPSNLSRDQLEALLKGADRLDERRPAANTAFADRLPALNRLPAVAREILTEWWAAGCREAMLATSFRSASELLGKLTGLNPKGGGVEEAFSKVREFT